MFINELTFVDYRVSIGDEEDDFVDRRNDLAVGDGAECPRGTLHRFSGYGGAARNGSRAD